MISVSFTVLEVVGLNPVIPINFFFFASHELHNND